MSLATYHKKRHFTRTPEPRGRRNPNAQSELMFVVQKHDASRLHYDFRLELDGVLKSWAVPKGPSLDPNRKSLAVQVEDHPIDYGDFEGVIPKGEYGGGTVLLWDTGTWEPLHDPVQGLKDGKLHFVLNGKKLRGEWSLVQMHGKAGGDGKNWLLMKSKDKFASDKDILGGAPKSVKTSRTLDEIADERDDVWTSKSGNSNHHTAARKSELPDDFSPQLATLAKSPPAGDEWLHEIKFDGYRILSRIDAGNVKLITRNGNDWTEKFPGIARSLGQLKADSAIVDGELVVLDKQGRSDFQALQQMLKHKGTTNPVYFAFDLLFLDGNDLRQKPLLERKEKLEELLRQSNLPTSIRYSEHVQGNGNALIEKACTMGLEGIVSKRIDGLYLSRRDPSWSKSKCGARQELVVIGYTDPQGTREGFGSLLLGYHDTDGKLVYAGRVGTGFDQTMLKETFQQFQKLRLDDPPEELSAPKREMRAAHWLQPKLVAEVKFSGWTRDGMLRHPAFVAFRSDKPAEEIVREQPVKPKKVRAITRSGRKAHAGSLPERAAPTPTLPRSTRGGGKQAPGGDARSYADSFAGVKLSHPDKVLYPESGTTKRDVAAYYENVQEWMLPHVIQRPLALVRCPGGVANKCFFQRNWTESLPPAVGKVDVGQGKKQDFHVTVSDLAGVISLAQIGVLEIHTWNCRVDHIERPDQLVFDLDPGADVTWKRIAEATRLLKRTLDSLHLPTFLKTSGGKGLHITIPIKPNIDWDSAKRFTSEIAKSLAERSELFVANMRKDLRPGKVYIDYNRNGRSATAVAPYSTRARVGAPVSMPISWDELGKIASADHFKVQTAGRYLEKRKRDPWQEFESSRVDLRELVDGKSAA